MLDTSSLVFQPVGHVEFDICGDLSGSRFFGPNRQHDDKKKRGNLIFDFLHSAARLTLDQLSHKEGDYWIREQSVDRRNNHFGSPLESIHHLFCNLSEVDVAVAVVKDNQILSPLYAKHYGVFDESTNVIRIQY